MRLCLDEDCVDYGECPTIEYYTDICEEIDENSSEQDHMLEFSGYPVGKARFLENGMISIQIYSYPNESEASFPVSTYLNELERARETIFAMMG